MSIAPTVAQILRDRVLLEVESIDRLYLNVYVPQLQRELGVVSFFRFHRDKPFASSALMEPMSQAFIKAVERFIAVNKIPFVRFRKGQRKDDLARAYLKDFSGEEGVLFIGVAQEKTPVFRTERRRHPETGKTYPWIVRSTAMVNHYYFYCLDRDFGPFFLKFCTYFPYNAKLCLNGHEYVKRQLDRRAVAYEPLDNGILSCEDPKKLQALCDGLGPAQIDHLLRKWLRRLPHPYLPMDRRAGFRYDLSILQAEFSLTQVLDRPRSGRAFFEEIVRENVDLGRPDQVQLIFGRRVTRRTPGLFRTRVITRGVVPSLHIDYKRSRIKQYHKEGRALRTETTINDTRDFGIGRRLRNLPALRAIGFTANRRLLDVQKLSYDCTIGEAAFNELELPQQVGPQKVPRMRFADPRVQALLHALVLFRFLPGGFANHDLREQLPALLGIEPGRMTPGRMSYDLRRMRLRGLIERLPGTHRYQVTAAGLRVALFYTRAYARILRPGLSLVIPEHCPGPTPLRSAFLRLEKEMDTWCARLENAA